MTHEEMAHVLETVGIQWAARLSGQPTSTDDEEWNDYIAGMERMVEALKAGAAALRAMEWKQVPDDPDKIPDRLGAHRVCGRWLEGEWMTETETSPTFIDYSKPTHYFELPPPPEAA